MNFQLNCICIEEWGSDSKYTHYWSNHLTAGSFDKEKAYIDSKLPVNSTTSDTGFRFEASSRNNRNFDDPEKSRPSKPNSFSNSATSISNQSESEVNLEDTYGGLFLEQPLDKSNLALSQQFDHHSSTNFNEVR